MLKQLIKNLSAEQIALKKDRKTGTYDYRTVQIETLQKSWQAASKVQDNRLKITAALNLYHEQRGSDYRHEVQDSDQYRYQFHLKELSNQLVAK